MTRSRKGSTGVSGYGRGAWRGNWREIARPFGFIDWRAPNAEPIWNDAVASPVDRFDAGSPPQSGNRIDPELVERALVSGRFLVVDSGVGGLAVAREIRRQQPTAEIVYAADDAGFPYGEMAERELTGHVVRHSSTGFAIEYEDNLDRDVRRMVDDAAAVVAVPR